MSFTQVPVESVAVLAKEDVNAQEWLLIQYQNLIKSVAKPYFIAGGNEDDVVQEANIGFLKAIEKFEPGYNFIKFSKLVMRRQIYDAIRKANRIKYKSLNESISMDSEDFIDPWSFDSDPVIELVDTESQDKFNKQLTYLLSELEYQVAQCMMAGMGLGDIRKELGFTYRSVDNAVQRIKKKLERWYE